MHQRSVDVQNESVDSGDDSSIAAASPSGALFGSDPLMIPALRARRRGLAGAAFPALARPRRDPALTASDRTLATLAEIAGAFHRAQSAPLERESGEHQLVAACLSWLAGDETAAAELLAQVERSFVRAGAGVFVVAVGLECAALAARAEADAAGEALAE